MSEDVALKKIHPMNDDSLNTFKKIRQAENECIKERRAWAGLNKKMSYDIEDPIEEVLGLALSGGGMPSAAFNLGLLRTLQAAKALKFIDYLSTVSGGSYIASTLIWLTAKLKTFPFNGKRSVFSTLKPPAKSFFNAVTISLTAYIIVLISFFFIMPSGGADQKKLYRILNIFAAVVPFIAVLFVNVNKISPFHRFRKSLIEIFMPSPFELEKRDNPKEPKDAVPETPEDQKKNQAKGATTNPNHFLLQEIPINAVPYLIINTTVEIPGSKAHTLCSRGSDNFIMSRLFCGSDAGGYIETKAIKKNKPDLGTALTISGTEASAGSSGLRPGFRVKNPARDQAFKAPAIGTLWYQTLMAKLRGKSVYEEHNYIHLSGGSYFDNLGLYELIRRQCTYIIVSDACEDKQWRFSHLEKVKEMVRQDFAATITIDTTPLIPNKETGLSQRSFVFGKIRYDREGAKSRESVLVYIKASVTKEMSGAIRTYSGSHPGFPAQSEGSFDESGLEALRKLGIAVAQDFCKGFNRGDAESLCRPRDGDEERDGEPEKANSIIGFLEKVAAFLGIL
ncbi:MAG: hypothetical protein GY757_36260 [bacterium]|nr:hypothetical protein [bacterium]